MTTKHTPKPWVINWSDYSVVSDDKGATMPIARIACRGEPHTDGNLRLIAAAPDLLEALERLDLTMFPAGKHTHSPYGTFNEDDARMIRAALAKAREPQS